jgi:hypothetical protein
MLAPGISAFAASETVPLRLALLDCPNTCADRPRKKKHVARPKHFLFLIVDPLHFKKEEATRRRGPMSFGIVGPSKHSQFSVSNEKFAVALPLFFRRESEALRKEREDLRFESCRDLVRMVALIGLVKIRLHANATLHAVLTTFKFFDFIISRRVDAYCSMGTEG